MTSALLKILCCFVAFWCVIAIMAYPHEPNISLKYFLEWNANYFYDNLPSMNSIYALYDTVEELFKNGQTLEGFLKNFELTFEIVKMSFSYIWFIIKYIFSLSFEFFRSFGSIVMNGTNVPQ